MDPFSQAALGAVVAQSITSRLIPDRTIGYRAALFGAMAGAMPDIDVLFSINGDFIDQLVLHRGITHSLIFAPVVGPLLGWLVWRRERHKDPSVDSRELRFWITAITLAVLSHPLLDLLTTYGTVVIAVQQCQICRECHADHRSGLYPDSFVRPDLRPLVA